MVVYTIPIWLALLALIVIVFVAWKLLKFAIWIFVLIAIIALTLIGLDFLIGLFSRII
jgi:hypothetical protein